jgi:hypothetical protein
MAREAPLSKVGRFVANIISKPNLWKDTKP